MRIVLDSNVYIAAFFRKGLASEILNFGIDEEIQIYASNEILLEVKKKLFEKFKVDDKYVRRFIGNIKIWVYLVQPKTSLNVVKADPDDNKIIECAVEAKANLIVSMDKHLLKLKSYEGIGIIHPKTLTWIIPKILGKD